MSEGRERECVLNTFVSTWGNFLLMCLMAESRVLSERQAGLVLGSRHDYIDRHI